ncbi:hypothetical protein CIK05_09330 [Bdellovibrio sp. qaytius]|nr:hypothetical protein CIK05_09330 [Bdellovibrio sp. qaytius]
MILCFAFTSTAAADSIKGRIKKVDNTFLLVTKTQIAYTLDFTNSVSEQQIKRLTNGDFASVTANFSSISPTLIYVSSVDYVGLNMLTGIWKSDSDLCYEFSTFTRMYVYGLDEAGHCVRGDDPNDFGKYTYFINPDVDEWNMLISSNNSEYVGNLNIITDDHITIELFDSRTDATLGTIVLRR